jgi:rare lipoprotein A
MKRITLIQAVFLTAVFLAGAQTPSEGAIFRQEGIASWYGAEFMGRPTASGEIFNPSLLTAAHPALPFGTLLRVTNTQNSKQVIVRINDRGPYVSSRIIDISQAAAEQLDMISTGTAPVIVESLSPLSSFGSAGALSETFPSSPAPDAGERAIPVVPAVPYQPAVAPDSRTTPVPTSGAALVDPSPAWTSATAPQTAARAASPPATVPVVGPPAAASDTAASPAAAFPSRPVVAPQSPRTSVSAVVLPSMPPMGTGKHYRVQVGAFRVPRYASEAFDKLKNLGFNPAYEQYEEKYRVVISGVRPEQIPAIAEQLGTAGFPEILVREER